MKILTDYQIIKSQCPRWEEQTQNIDYLPFWGSGYAFAKYYWVKAIRLFWRRSNYDLVITGDFRGGQVYAFLQWLFPRQRRPQLMLDFMLDEEKPCFFWRLKRAVQRRILAGVDCILVFSRNELADYVQLLGIPKERFHFLYYHTNIIQPRRIAGHEGYVFAAGNAGRDYATLLKALEGTGIPLIIVTSPKRMKGLPPPAGVKIFYDIAYLDYLDLLAKAQVVVVPLKSRLRSVGMVVMLEGMALGKPVVVTRASSNQEYIRQGENGFLVEVGDAAALREKIICLRENPAEAEKIGRQALDDINNYWTFEHYVGSVLEIAKEMVESK